MGSGVGHIRVPHPVIPPVPSARCSLATTVPPVFVVRGLIAATWLLRSDGGGRCPAPRAARKSVVVEPVDKLLKDGHGRSRL